MTKSTTDLIDTLALQVPAFEEARRKHVEFNDELLPYVLLEDFVSTWLEPHSSHPAATEVLATLEEFYREGNDELRNLIAICLLEGLTAKKLGSEQRMVHQQLGPTLRVALQEMKEWRPSAT